jgi:hypothetical protein
MRDATERRNLHVPLPEPMYRALRAEAESSGRPATDLARKAIDEWLRRARKARIHGAVARYASQHAGGVADLDVELESAAVAHLKKARARRR